MLLSTPGLVLHTTPYSESSVIAKVFTRLLGVRSYIVKGVRGSRNKAKMNLLQPLSYLDMVVYDSARTGLNHIKEMRPAEPLPALSGDIRRSALVFFMDELLYKVLREEEPQPPLFDYTVECLRALDAQPLPDPSFPIHFLLRTARHIGIEPRDDYGPGHRTFDLEAGRFEVGRTPLSPELSLLMHQYLAQEPVSAPLPTRIDLINALVRYYQIHIADFSHFHSHEVLHSVLAATVAH